MTEDEIEEEFADWLKSEGHDSERLATKHTRGFPDLTVWLSNGKTLYVEMKRPGGHLSIHQKRWMRRLRESRQPWAACWSLESAQAFVRSYL